MYVCVCAAKVESTTYFCLKGVQCEAGILLNCILTKVTERVAHPSTHTHAHAHAHAHALSHTHSHSLRVFHFLPLWLLFSFSSTDDKKTCPQPSVPMRRAALSLSLSFTHTRTHKYFVHWFLSSLSHPLSSLARQPISQR